MDQAILTRNHVKVRGTAQHQLYLHLDSGVIKACGMP